MSPMEFMKIAIEFGGIKRNFEHTGELLYGDVESLIELTEKLMDAHQKQVHQEIRLLKELSELKNELGKGDSF